jgi:cytochrome P450
MATLSDVADIDLFTDDNLLDPYPLYAALRSEAPAVFLPRADSWAVARYDGVREVLGDWERFTSARGVGMNDEVNRQLVGTVLASDPPLHDTLRGVLAERLSPRSIRSLSGSITEQAERLVESLVARSSFDAIADLARVFPPSIVADLVGIPHDVRPRLLPWGDGLFNTMGPVNDRTIAAVPLLQEQYGWLHSIDASVLAPGSMGRAIFEAAEAGVIERASAPQLLSAYTSAAMDTTVNAIGSAVWLFATHPEQWRALRADRSLVPSAFNEVLRYESPLQMFTRVATRDLTIDGVAIAEGDRLMALYGASGRDERHWGDTAGDFDITRDASDHLAFGYGLHGCAGQGFARLEAHAVFTALADRVEAFELTGPPVRHLNNTIRGLESLPVRLHAA